MNYKRNRYLSPCFAALLTFLTGVAQILAAPAITTQPVQRQVVKMGENLTLSVAASGGGDLSYQWFHNRMAVMGGTSTTLTLNNVKYTDAGAYQVKATDSTGVITSSAGFVNVSLGTSMVVQWDPMFVTQGAVIAVGDVVAISAGGNNSLALKSDGTVLGWGGGSVPPGLNDVVAIAAADHNLALKSDGTVVAWGNNIEGDCIVPADLKDVVAIAVGGSHCLALKSDGTVVVWGANYNGEGIVPTGLSDVVSVAAGWGHNLALKSDGTVVAWGLYDQSTVPTGLTGVIAVAAGSYDSLALKSDGTVLGWGGGSVPPGLTNVVAIASDGLSSLALKSDGTVVGWGAGSVPAGVSRAVAIAGGGLALQPLQPPAAPTNVNASDNDSFCTGKVQVTWTASSVASSYRVFRATSATGDKVAISAWLSDTFWQSGTSFYDTTATSGVVYYYSVVASTDSSGSNTSDYSTYDTGIAAFTTSETVFSNWMTTHGVNGLPASGFAADRDADGVANGLEYAFGANRQAGEQLIVVSPANGTLMVGMLKQADETRPYVGLAIKCSTDLHDWSYPLVPATNITGLDANRTWYQPQGSPTKVFFRLEATLIPDPFLIPASPSIPGP